MSTTTFKTNLNSASNGCSLAALKHHITTCLQRWRQKHLSTKKVNKQHQSQQEECHCQHNSSRWFKKSSNKEYSFVQRTTVNYKIFSTKFHKLLTSHSENTCHKDFTSKGPRKYGRKVEIVAKLLSTTLVATATTSTATTATEEFSQQTNSAYCSFEEKIKIVQSSTSDDAMTITNLTFLEIRDEYPELDAEIRAILTARAQEGATISEIRDDYRKLTGMKFPVYDNVTEYLLSIPYVSAYCSEKGTRLFSIRPTEKTKHIHDMVTHQKTQQEPPMQKPTHRYYYRERPRNHNYNPYNWRRNSSLTRQPEIISDVQVKAPQKQGVISTDNNISREDSEGFVENNWYYTDNCNYLYSRMCNQQNMNQPPMSQLIINPNTNNIEQPQTLINPTTTRTSRMLNNYNANIVSCENNNNNLLQLQQQQYQQQTQKNVKNNMDKPHTRYPFSNPIKTGKPRSSRSSSPTVKSCYTSDSVYTDSDYDAHLLDFLLLGDDFLLYMARMELRCKFKKNQRILQSGLCVSGQTISGAIKRIRALNDSRRSIILNIGSVDIMQGKQLIKIEHEFRELVVEMLKKGMKPILTTVAPLANYSHDTSVKLMIERFNEFIKREGVKRNLTVIDIWKCLVNEKGQVFFDCYQNEPRNVSGTTESYLFWNKIGRQRVLQLIESKLEY